MQTFLLSTNYKQSAQWLDNQRLGKQRVEVFQILKALTDPSYGWQHHPAVKMWRGYELALFAYGSLCCDEWRRVRGYKDSCNAKMIDLMWDNGFKPSVLEEDYVKPDWLTEEFASNHRSILLGKAKEAIVKIELFDVWMENGHIKSTKRYERVKRVLDWYQSFEWTEAPAQRNEKGQWPYIWPTKEFSK